MPFQPDDLIIVRRGDETYAATYQVLLDSLKTDLDTTFQLKEDTTTTTTNNQ